MKLGIVTPVLTLLPRAHAKWEETGTLDDVVEIAREADRLGYHHLTCSEHVAIPTDVAETRGGRYWDPLATFGFIAANTQTIRLASHVLVLGYHHPLQIAKRYGTLDRVSNGRLVLGVGVGSLEEEFALLDAPFADRGARADDAMRALRAALSQPQPEYHGPFYDFAGFVVDPCAQQEHVPMWVGGRTARSLRRAVELADGWAPFGLDTTQLTEMIERARATDAWAARATPLELVLQNERALDPAGEPDRVTETVGHLAEIGATALNVRFVHHSPAHYREQLAALGEYRARSMDLKRQYIASIQSDSDRVVAGLAANPEAPIPWCGDWTVKDCAHHVGGLHHILAGVIEGRPTATFGLFKTLHPPKADDPALGPWISEGTAALVEQVQKISGDEPCWVFQGQPQTVAFWPRRAAHETMVHRWDIEKAAGIAIVPQDPALASDGVDEYLDVFVAMMRGGQSSPGAGETADVHCTDTDGEWFLEFTAAGAQVVTREHKKGDVAFRGPAEGLLLFLWGHESAEDAGVETVGDAALAARWRELVPAV